MHSSHRVRDWRMKHRNIKDKHKPFIEVEIGSSNATCLYHLAYIQKKESSCTQPHRSMLKRMPLTNHQVKILSVLHSKLKYCRSYTRTLTTRDGTANKMKEYWNNFPNPASNLIRVPAQSEQPVGVVHPLLIAYHKHKSNQDFKTKQ